MAFAAIGGSGAIHLFLRSFLVKMAATRVAREPKTISGRAQPVKILDNKHPINNPGTAAGVK